MHFYKLSGALSQPELYYPQRHETNQQRPRQNFEHRVRVFVKNPAKEELARRAFERYASRNNLIKKPNDEHESMNYLS